MGRQATNFRAFEWDPAGVQHGRVLVPQLPAGVPVLEESIIGARGCWNCCDFHLNAPVAWLNVVLTLSVSVDGVEVELERKLVSECTYHLNGANLQAHVFSLRGHPGSGFIIKAVRPVFPNTAPEGFGRLVCWGQDTAGEAPELGPRRYPTAGALVLRASHILEAAPCHLEMISAYNNNAAVRYLLCFDAVAVPAAATPPDIVPIVVHPDGNASLSFGRPGRRFPTGLVWAASTTPDTFTAAGADLLVSAEYRTP